MLDDDEAAEEGGGRRNEEDGTGDDGHSEVAEVHEAHEHPWAAGDLAGLVEGRDVQVEEDHTPDGSGGGVNTELHHLPSCRPLRWLIPYHHPRLTLH